MFVVFYSYDRILLYRRFEKYYADAELKANNSHSENGIFNNLTFNWFYFTAENTEYVPQRAAGMTCRMLIPRLTRRELETAFALISPKRKMTPMIPA